MAKIRHVRASNPQAIVRVLLSRGMVAATVMLAVSFAALGQRSDGTVANVETALTDAMAPALDFVSRPVEKLNEMAAQVESWTRLSEDNNRLREERAALLQWEARARQLEIENQQLRQLLHMVPDPQWRYITARALSDAGGTFVHSVLIAAGTRDGVQEGQPAVTGEGLAGRVIEVGQSAGRVLLITDISSRVPVAVERTGSRAILAGDNSATAKLLYLSADARVAVGDRIVTTAYGGTFPPGLPVGTVSSIVGRVVSVTPFIDSDRLDYLQLLDYELTQDLRDLPGGPQTAGGARPQ